MKSKDIIKFITIAIFCVFITTFGMITIAEAEDTPLVGGIKVEVQKEDGTPAVGAKVYVCEIAKCYETNKGGQTPNIEIPIKPDKRFLEICKKDYGEVTLIITCEGYPETCVLNTVVRPNLTRLGPKITLKKSESPQYIQDPPDKAWLTRLTQKFSKGSDVEG